MTKKANKAQSAKVFQVSANGANWAQVINSSQKLPFIVEFSDGAQIKVIEYFKAHHFKKGSKTAITYETNGTKYEAIETDRVRKIYCKDYEAKEHAKKVKVFHTAENLKLATLAELAELEDAINAERARRKEEKEAKKARLLAELAELED